MRKPNITKGEWVIHRPKKSERLVVGENPDKSDALVCACEIDEDAKAISAVPNMISALSVAIDELEVLEENGVPVEGNVIIECKQALIKAGCK